MNQNRRERILIITTIVLALFMIGCFIYDSSKNLLKRTLAYELPQYAKVVEIDKHGFSFYRVGYEAKVLVDANNPEDILACFVNGYDFSGSMMSYQEYQEISELLFGEDGQLSYADIVPNPASGSGVWMCEVITEEGHTIVQLLDIENSDDSYLYIYYIR
ncbi:MAG: hypothetical protein MJ094_03585 [Saccharofermentans sp.]|nr:hypothetical protein [Saccharofermentans sp.]